MRFACSCCCLQHASRRGHLFSTHSALLGSWPHSNADPLPITFRTLQMWVLFRDENGAAACVKDECAHRACPLSLGAVVAGRLQCPYVSC